MKQFIDIEVLNDKLKFFSRLSTLSSPSSIIYRFKTVVFSLMNFHHFCLLLAADKVSQNFSPKHITDYRKTRSKHHSNNVDDRHKSLLIDGNYRKFFTFIRRKFVLIVKTKAVHYNIYHSRPIFQFT